MAASLGTNHYNRKNWEDSDFPILCQTCLGDNPYIRMTKEKFGKECKICTRPFTVFRWCPGAGMRFKKCEVCQTCAKLKNVCQTCMLDLEYGLPIQVRDHALKIKDDLPRSDVNREYYLQNVDAALANSSDVGPGGALGKLPSHKSELLQKLARTTPYYKRNRPHICSFWVKGECKRGEECPYRHEKPTDPDDPLSQQNIKDRYYGVNDPVAEKLLKRAQAMPHLEPPEDSMITTLYVGGLDEAVSEQDIKNAFYAYGEIRSITLVSKQGCAFVQFTTRKSAERAADSTFNKLNIRGNKVTIRWGKSQGKTGGHTPLVPSEAPNALPAPPIEVTKNYFGLAGGSAPPPPGGFPGLAMANIPNSIPLGGMQYPSQDPSRMGAQAQQPPNQFQ